MEPQTQQQSSAIELHCNLDYLKSPFGILKIVEIVLGMITFACATSIPYGAYGYGWVSFVGICGFVGALISLVLNLVFTINWKWNLIIDLVWYGIWTFFFLIAGIVAAAQANTVYPYNHTGGAAAAFSFFAMIAWGVDTAFQARRFRIHWFSSSNSPGNPSTTVTTTHTTHQTEYYEENPKY